MTTPVTTLLEELISDCSGTCEVVVHCLVHCALVHGMRKLARSNALTLSYTLAAV